MSLNKLYKILGVLILIGFLFIHFFVPRLIVQIDQGAVKGKSLVEPVEANFVDNQLPGKVLHFQSIDNVQMEAYLTYSQLDTVLGTILLLHGIRGKKEHFMVLSK